MQRRIHVLIGGGSGFIGSALCDVLRARGDRVTLISRTPGADRMTWRELAAKGLPACDAVINLAGQHILNLRRRWNAAYRDEVINSRVETTRLLVRALNQSATPPEVFVSTAGKCFYGTRELKAAESHPELDEDSAPMGLDFPAELVARWEAAADGVDAGRIRHAKLRIGVVLGKAWRASRAHGFLPIIRVPFRLGVGAVIGTGRQLLPWVHIEDMIGILLRAIDRSEMRGRYNAVSPGIVSNREFVEAFARCLGRPVLWSVPEGLVRFVVGEERSSILLRGQFVRPKRTLEAGYVFRFPRLEPALQDLVHAAASNRRDRHAAQGHPEGRAHWHR
jgi:uncharacterized protein